MASTASVRAASPPRAMVTAPRHRASLLPAPDCGVSEAQCCGGAALCPGRAAPRSDSAALPLRSVLPAEPGVGYSRRFPSSWALCTSEESPDESWGPVGGRLSAPAEGEAAGAEAPTRPGGQAGTGVGPAVAASITAAEGASGAAGERDAGVRCAMAAAAAAARRDRSDPPPPLLLRPEEATPVATAPRSDDGVSPAALLASAPPASAPAEAMAEWRDRRAEPTDRRRPRRVTDSRAALSSARLLVWPADRLAASAACGAVIAAETVRATPGGALGAGDCGGAGSDGAGTGLAGMDDDDESGASTARRLTAGTESAGDDDEDDAGSRGHGSANRGLDASGERDSGGTVAVALGSAAELAGATSRPDSRCRLARALPAASSLAPGGGTGLLACARIDALAAAAAASAREARP